MAQEWARGEARVIIKVELAFSEEEEEEEKSEPSWLDRMQLLRHYHPSIHPLPAQVSKPDQLALMWTRESLPARYDDDDASAGWLAAAYDKLSKRRLL